MKDFYSEIVKLKNIKRRGWELRKFNVDRVESDAEHVYSMLFLAFYFLNKYDNIELDVTKVYNLILCHELGEIEIGDITPFDNYDTKLKHMQEHDAISRLSKLYDIDKLLELWNEYNEKKQKRLVLLK